MATRLKPQIVSFYNKAEKKENVLENICDNRTYKNRIMKTNGDVSKEINRIIEENK